MPCEEKCMLVRTYSYDLSFSVYLSIPSFFAFYHNRLNIWRFWLEFANINLNFALIRKYNINKIHNERD